MCVLPALVSLFLTPNLGCFLSLFFREVFNSSLSFFFWSPMIWVLVDLRLCQRPLSPSMLFWISFLSSYRCVRTHTHAHLNVCLFILLVIVYRFLHFPTLLSPPYPHPPPTFNFLPLWLCPWALYMCSFLTLSFLSHVIFLFPPLWLWSVCS